MKGVKLKWKKQDDASKDAIGSLLGPWDLVGLNLIKASPIVTMGHIGSAAIGSRYDLDPELEFDPN